jgi:hypothetical protein
MTFDDYTRSAHLLRPNECTGHICEQDNIITRETVRNMLIKQLAKLMRGEHQTSLRITEIVSHGLECIGAKTIFIKKNVIMCWSASSLSKVRKKISEHIDEY